MTELELKQLNKISKQIVNDIEFLENAFKFTRVNTDTFLHNITNNELVCSITIEYAAWVYCEFEKDDGKYIAFLKKHVENRKSGGNMLFEPRTPSNDSPNEEANRILNRIDIALNFYKSQFDMEIPFELKGENRDNKPSIRNGGYKQEKLLKIVKSFALSAYDLFIID
jgi:hypothetical protein